MITSRDAVKGPTALAHLPMKRGAASGLLGWGVYVPRQRVAPALGSATTRRMSRQEPAFSSDEDTVTMALAASHNALLRCDVRAQDLRAIWIGSGSSPYAEKPAATMVATALGAGPLLLAADFSFGGKSGTEALQACLALTGSGMGYHALACGADIPCGSLDDPEYAATAASAAFVVGPAADAVATVEGALSYVTDTPDAVRHARSLDSECARRFSNESYLEHGARAASELLDRLGLRASQLDHVVFHCMSARLLRELGRRLGVSTKQLAATAPLEPLGNTLASSALLGLAAVLDTASPGQSILCVSYASGAGSDAFLFRTTTKLPEAQRRSAPRCVDYLARIGCFASDSRDDSGVASPLELARASH